MYLPKNIKNINDFTFADTNVTEIIIPKNVKKIGKNAFARCEKFKAIIFNDDLPKKDNDAFEYDYALKRLIFMKPDAKLTGLSQFIKTHPCPADELTLVGATGSTIEKYAKRYNYKFEML